MSELEKGEALLKELQGTHLQKNSAAPTMGNLKRCSYTHKAMIDLILEHPEMDQNHIAAHFGYTASWVSNILASDAFQSQMAARREEILDPVLRATMEERFRALAIQSLEVLQRKLAMSTVSDTLALRAAELGAKALGIGGHAPPPAAPNLDRLEKLAGRLVNLRERVINAEIVSEVPDAQAG